MLPACGYIMASFQNVWALTKQGWVGAMSWMCESAVLAAAFVVSVLLGKVSEQESL